MKARFLILILIFISNSLSADIQDFFKPALNKSDKNQMKGIDFIYMINLDERPEKFAISEKQLAAYNIFPYRFSAVNGWEIPLKNLKLLGIQYESWMKNSIMGTRYRAGDSGVPLHENMIVGKNYFSHCMSRGAVGIVLSHLSILQDAYDSGYQTIWVMEDDVEVIQDPNILSKYIKQLDSAVGKKKWDILFTDPDTKGQNGNYVPCLSYAPRPNFTPQNPDRFSLRKDVNSVFKKIGARYGAYSMIVRRSGIRKILNFIKTYSIFLPYDMEFYLPNDINMYSLNFDVVSTLPKALSDNGAPNYNRKKTKQGQKYGY
jgi:GR25 family glycosyltransferase involved in LPS biosynthesis